MSKESKIILSIAAVVAVLIGGLIYFTSDMGKPSEEVVSERLVRDDSHKLGDGKVELVEFGDYQCPGCAQVHPIVKRITDEFGDKITFVFRNFPLPQLHPNANIAAEAAEAAGAQGKFWEMHDILYENQNSWSALSDPTDTFVRYAEDIGIDKKKFKESITDRAFKDKINRDQSDGYALGITGTPTFYLDGKLQSSFDYDSLKRAIQEELDK